MLRRAARFTSPVLSTRPLPTLHWTLAAHMAPPPLPSGHSPDRDRPATIISPSILSSDFARLADEADSIIKLRADWLHVDVMDGHFVPNLTLGPPIVASLRKHTDAFLDCHLMVSNPQQWVEDFAQAGANMYTFHLECFPPYDAPFEDGVNSVPQQPVEAVSELIDAIHAAGMHAGMTIKPGTPVETMLPYLDQLDMVLIMTVEPGFGGQKFMPDQMKKVQTLRRRAPGLLIEVDGGLSPSTIEQAAEAGANVIVAGSAVFGASDPGAVIAVLRAAVDKAATTAGTGTNGLAAI